jgi:hypothetical protein
MRKSQCYPLTDERMHAVRNDRFRDMPRRLRTTGMGAKRTFRM